ncbi:polysaccharide deacetylase family protein [Granulosicoccaceae sp. 1_MG-2023]|nr:polysaccharide deacetylase family protein [Granulosicoccaceae sp. 1_MG-2023]
MSLRDVLPSLVRPFSRLWFGLNPGARILMYHRVADLPAYDQLTVSTANFERQIAWLAANREVVSLPDLLAQISEGRPAANRVVITFDDGYLDNLENALPVLEKYQVPATIYVTSEFAAQSSSHPRYRGDSRRLHLNWTEVGRLGRHPLITIGSHTVTHPMLSELDAAGAEREISRSKADIETHTGLDVIDFCYPSGNFTERERESVKKAGYRSAVTVKPGSNNACADVFALRRTEVTDKDTPAQLAQKLDGAFDIFHWLLDLKREKTFSANRKQA